MADDDDRLVIGSMPNQRENAEQHGEMLSRVADRLLAIGGEKVVVPPDPPPFVWFLLTLMTRDGQVFETGTVRLDEGDPSDCHVNVVRLWREGHGAICTGFALSPDDYWRHHSWIRDPSGAIVETTEVRSVYFGFEFDDEGAELFAGPVAD
jgi:hypothetical protein